MASFGESSVQGADLVLPALDEISFDVMADLGAVDEQTCLYNSAHATRVIDFQPPGDEGHLLNLDGPAGSDDVAPHLLAPGDPCNSVEGFSMEVDRVGLEFPGASSCGDICGAGPLREEPSVVDAQASLQPNHGVDEVGSVGGGDQQVALHPPAGFSTTRLFDLLANMYEVRSVLVEAQRFCILSLSSADMGGRTLSDRSSRFRQQLSIAHGVLEKLGHIGTVDVSEAQLLLLFEKVPPPFEVMPRLSVKRIREYLAKIERLLPVLEN